MDYESYFNKFWELDEELHFSPPEVKYYFYLLHKMYQADSNPFSLTIRIIKNELRMPNERITALSDRLKKRGLIDYSVTGRNISLQYSLL